MSMMSPFCGTRCTNNNGSVEARAVATRQVAKCDQSIVARVLTVAAVCCLGLGTLEVV